MKRFNFLTAHPQLEPGSPEGFRELTSQLNEEIGAEHLSGQLIELPPGERSGPYHWEAAKEEWLLVVFGSPTVRHPEGESELRPGDLVCFPAGPAGAHQLMNRGDGSCRVVMFSNVAQTNVIMYVDSGKVGVRAGHVRGNYDVAADLDYWHGET